MSGDATGGLYPFLERGPGREPGAEGGPSATELLRLRDELLAEVRDSTLRKAEEVTRLRARMWERHGEQVARAARLVAASFRQGGKVLAFGNGGSATDAQDLLSDLADPPVPGWRPRPAICLVDDRGVLTAVANDVGFDHVFARQVIAFGEEGDVAVGFSTSGTSPNVLEAFDEARRRGMATVGFTGNEGGRMAEPGALDAVVVAPSTHIPRIQEAHATAYHAMLHLVHALLGDDVGQPPADQPPAAEPSDQERP